MQNVHFKIDEINSACGALVEFIKNSSISVKKSQVTCPECLNVMHKELRFKVKWKENFCELSVFKGRKRIGGGQLAHGKSIISFISDVYVLPEYRGIGLGARIVRELVQRGGLPVMLKAIPFALNATENPISESDLIKFYEEIGFIKTGNIPNMICIPKIPMYSIKIEKEPFKDIFNYRAFVESNEGVKGIGITPEQALTNLIIHNKTFFGIKITDPYK